MSGTFFGINVAYTGIAAQRQALDVLSQNIAHANDPTYKRQRVVATEGYPLAQSQDSGSGVSMVGSGVQTGDVQRIRDAMVESRLQQAESASAQYDFMSNNLSQIESAIGEPSDDGLQADLSAFWASWDQVATSPDSESVRNSLLDTTQTLCSHIQYVYSQISSTEDTLNTTAVNDVNSINSIASQIADINHQLTAIPSGTSQANDLLDSRDGLVQDLSKLVSVSQYGENGGDFVLSLGGRVLVQGTVANQLKTAVGASGNKEIQWSDDGSNAVIQGGELKAVLDLRDNVVPDYLSQMDQFATSLVNTVNSVHATGKTMDGADGGDFFLAGSTAANIQLDTTIVGKPRLIAASESGAIGNGNTAAQISALENKADASTGLTIDGMYRALVGNIGSDVSTAEKQSEASDLSYQQFQTQQQSISGVSLDEEMTNMIKFQQAYNASSRVMTVMDEMLSVLIDKTGEVGR